MEEKGPEHGRVYKWAKEFGFLLWMMGSQGCGCKHQFCILERSLWLLCGGWGQLLKLWW